MKIYHKLNNSAAICSNSSSDSIIVIGKGITFGKKEGDEIDSRELTKFTLILIKKLLN